MVFLLLCYLPEFFQVVLMYKQKLWFRLNNLLRTKYTCKFVSVFDQGSIFSVISLFQIFLDTVNIRRAHPSLEYRINIFTIWYTIIIYCTAKDKYNYTSIFKCIKLSELKQHFFIHLFQKIMKSIFYMLGLLFMLLQGSFQNPIQETEGKSRYVLRVYYINPIPEST